MVLPLLEHDHRPQGYERREERQYEVVVRSRGRLGDDTAELEEDRHAPGEEKPRRVMREERKVQPHFLSVVVANSIERDGRWRDPLVAPRGLERRKCRLVLQRKASVDSTGAYQIVELEAGPFLLVADNQVDELDASAVAERVVQALSTLLGVEIELAGVVVELAVDVFERPVPRVREEGASSEQVSEQ